MKKSEKITTVILMAFFLAAICYALTGCTISVIQTATYGQADDVVDSEPTQHTDVSPDVNFEGFPH